MDRGRENSGWELLKQIFSYFDWHIATTHRISFKSEQIVRTTASEFNGIEKGD